jgi:glycosyltransferase involved in cell wall biosynthesis
MSTPRVSVIITSYNYGRFVGEAVDSVLAQDFPAEELEVLVVDDGSTDDTPERVRRYGERIRYIRKSNGGQASALNAGFANARADILALLDADDVWLPGKLARVMAEFARHGDAVMVQHTRRICFTESGREQDEASFPGIAEAFPLPPADLLRCGITATSALAYRRSLLGGVLPIPEILTNLADSYVSAMAMLKGRVISLSEPLTKYRIHGQNLYSFDDRDPKRAARRLAQMETFVSEVKREISALRPSYPGAGLDDYLERFRLNGEAHRFGAYGAGRMEFFRHLRSQERLYGGLWTARYRLFQSALSLAALALGYEAFCTLRSTYAKKSLPLEIRRRFFPSEQVLTAS